MAGTMERMAAEAGQIGQAHAMRFLWGPVLLNGSAILGIANIIANTSDPDTALSMLLGPLWLAVVGGICGSFGVVTIGMAYMAAAERATQLVVLEEASDLLKANAEHAPAAAFRTVLPRLRAALQITKAMPEKDEDVVDETSQLVAQLMSKDSDKGRERSRRIMQASIFLILSVIFFVASLLWITVAHMMGQHLKADLGLLAT